MFEDEAPPLTVAEIVDDPDQAAAYLAADRPNPDALAAISMLDPATLSHGGRVDLLVAIQHQQAWLAARQQRVLAAMAEHPHDAADPFDRTGASWVREDVACALRLSAVTAQSRLHTATELKGRLPKTLRLLDRGAISYLHARALSDAVTALDDKTATHVEERVLAKASEQTLANFKASVRRTVAAQNPAALDAQRDHAMTERRVCISPREDGMAELWALLPAEGAAAVITAVDALASATPADDDRSADQRRADALVDLGIAALHDPLLPKAHGMRPAVQVTVALSTLLGLDEQPGELAGHGPIPASVARRVAGDQTGTWRRLITDPTGRLLDYGTTTYRPPADLARHVMARDQTCTFPGCRRSAHRCDLDHAIPASAGGATSADNLAVLCRRHHRAKHEAGWRVRRDQHTGDSHWTAPTGHRYTSTPPPYPSDAPRRSDEQCRTPTNRQERRHSFGAQLATRALPLVRQKPERREGSPGGKATGCYSAAASGAP
jgi:hypothetical protein